MSQPCRRVGPSELEQLLAEARNLPRGRANYNLHPKLTDPIQRFFNCLQPGTYVRPHRHKPHRFELFLLISGRAGILIFDQQGTVQERLLLAPDAFRAVEIPGGLIHTVVALAFDTVLFEVKPGPYQKLNDKAFAPWAPPEGDPSCPALIAQWESFFAGAQEGWAGD